MPTEDQASAAEIDDLIGRFFAVFDNREGRVPQNAAMKALFAENAIIATHQHERCALSSPGEFMAPRVELLTSGKLTGFHEWEVSGQTEVLGPMAVRVSRYRKSGVYDNAPYAGGGTKIFQLAKISSVWKILALSWIDDNR